MGKYTVTKEYAATKMTCGEALSIYESTGRDKGCMGFCVKFMFNPTGVIYEFDESWGWLKRQSKSKEIIVLDLKDTLFNLELGGE